MELETLIVADSVSTPPDGKFYIHGGGISRLEVPSLPFPIPLGILLRLRIESEDDLRRSHRVGVVLRGPRGVPNVPGVEFDLAPPEDLPLLEGEEQFANVSLQINAVAVLAGLYRVEIALDGETVRELPIPVIVAEGPQPFGELREWPSSN